MKVYVTLKTWERSNCRNVLTWQRSVMQTVQCSFHD